MGETWQSSGPPVGERLRTLAIRGAWIYANTGLSARAFGLASVDQGADVFLHGLKVDAGLSVDVRKDRAEIVCIFVNPSRLAAWMDQHFSSGEGRMSLDPDYLLTFMLLHEVGHIRDGTPAARFADGELLQLNIEPSLAKASEERADEFAAGLIRHHAHAAAVSQASLTANWVAIALAKLSWNMQAYRSLDEFGAAATGKRSVFFDQGYSHPNLAWRILRSNNLIQQDIATKQLLDAFEDARIRGANPQPLYRRAD